MAFLDVSSIIKAVLEVLFVIVNMWTIGRETIFVTDKQKRPLPRHTITIFNN